MMIKVLIKASKSVIVDISIAGIIANKSSVIKKQRMSARSA